LASYIFILCFKLPTSHSNIPYTYSFVNLFDHSRLSVQHRCQWVTSLEMTWHNDPSLPCACPPGAGVCGKGILSSHGDASRENKARSLSQSGAMRGKATASAEAESFSCSDGDQHRRMQAISMVLTLEREAYWLFQMGRKKRNSSGEGSRSWDDTDSGSTLCEYTGAWPLAWCDRSCAETIRSGPVSRVHVNPHLRLTFL